MILVVMPPKVKPPPRSFARVLALLAVVLLPLLAGCVTRVVYERPEPPSQPLAAGWTERVLPAVVLLLNHRSPAP
jgi:hypothetical protein